jgi:8-oxo-dGTP pyrophosphatase MutT (NUDIX family)
MNFPRQAPVELVECAPIQVVTAAIVNERDKRLFMQRRSGTTRYPWHWGTPGGALYEDEGVWEGLFRELNEEHGLRVVRGLPFYVYCHDEPSVITGQITRVRCLYLSSEAIVGPYQVLADAVADRQLPARVDLKFCHVRVSFRPRSRPRRS